MVSSKVAAVIAACRPFGLSRRSPLVSEAGAAACGSRLGRQDVEPRYAHGSGVWRHVGVSAPNRDSNPFAAAVGERHPARRFRGRLAAPVTIVTAGDEDGRTGLTVSSIVVAEGEPPLVYFLLGATTDLFYAIEETRKFIVHVCAVGHRDLADVFAGLRPSPGGMFIGRPVTQTEYGPVLDDIGTRSFCSYRDGDEDSYSVIVAATIDRIDLVDIDDPLIYFRGRYRALE